MEVCLPTAVHIYRLLYVFCGKLGSKGKGCPSVWTSFISSVNLDFWTEERLCLLWMFPVWDSPWDWPGMQWPTEVWGTWKKAEKRVRGMLEDRNWLTITSQSVKKNSFSLDQEISYASHSAQGEPKTLYSRKQDVRKIPFCQGHSEQKDFLPTLWIKVLVSSTEFSLVKEPFLSALFFLFSDKV